MGMNFDSTQWIEMDSFNKETGDLMKITIEDLIYEFSDINKQTEIKLPTNAKTYDQISEEASKQFESSYSTDYNFSDSYQSPKSSIRMSP